MNDKQQWRPYEFTRYFIEEGKAGMDKLSNCVQTINLCDVKAYRQFKFNEYPDENLQFTLLTMYQGDNVVVAIPYEEFRGIFLDFLIDIGELDVRTIRAYPLK